MILPFYVETGFFFFVVNRRVIALAFEIGDALVYGVKLISIPSVVEGQ